MLTELATDDADFKQVEEQMQGSIREHKDNSGGFFYKYNIVKVSVPCWVFVVGVASVSFANFRCTVPV